MTRAAGLSRPREGASGFTLIEILASLVVLGLILVTLTAGMRFGQQALQAQSRDGAALNQVDPVDSLIRRLIAGVRTDRGAPARGGGGRFAGAARTLAFRAVLPAGIPAQRAREADMSLGVDGAHRLVLTWLPWYQNWIVPKPPPTRIALLDGIDHVEFGYWDPSLNLPPGGWVTAWNGASPPKLVRVRLVFAKGEKQTWPDIIVSPECDPWLY